MNIDQSWAVVWSASAKAMRAVRLREHLRRVNREIVEGQTPDEHVIAAMDTLEQACGYEREMKRLFRRIHEERMSHGSEGSQAGSAKEALQVSEDQEKQSGAKAG